MGLGSWRSRPEPGVEEAKPGDSWRKEGSFSLTESQALWISGRGFGVGSMSESKGCLPSTGSYSRGPCGLADASAVPAGACVPAQLGAHWQPWDPGKNRGAGDQQGAAGNFKSRGPQLAQTGSAAAALPRRNYFCRSVCLRWHGCGVTDPLKRAAVSEHHAVTAAGVALVLWKPNRGPRSPCAGRRPGLAGCRGVTAPWQGGPSAAALCPRSGWGLGAGGTRG